MVEALLHRLDVLNGMLSRKYTSVMIGKSRWFLIRQGEVCRICCLGGEYKALVLEYADNVECAMKNIVGEDGDLFYLDELNQDQMYKAMVSEIEEV